jgi:hypothetical protein
LHGPAWFRSVIAEAQAIRASPSDNADFALKFRLFAVRCAALATPAMVLRTLQPSLSSVDVPEIARVVLQRA